jgi:hypothetical protein
MTWGFIHYRQVVRQESNQTIPAADDLIRSQLLAKINHLENSFHQNQKVAAQMEARLGVDSTKIKMGVGPLSENDDFNKYLDKTVQLPKPTDGDFYFDIKDSKGR